MTRSRYASCWPVSIRSAMSARRCVGFSDSRTSGCRRSQRLRLLRRLLPRFATARAPSGSKHCDAYCVAASWRARPRWSQGDREGEPRLTPLPSGVLVLLARRRRPTQPALTPPRTTRGTRGAVGGCRVSRSARGVSLTLIVLRNPDRLYPVDPARAGPAVKLLALGSSPRAHRALVGLGLWARTECRASSEHLTPFGT
jgi:hypothetical protein